MSNSSHSEQLLLKMSELRDSRTLTDVSLKVGGRSFEAHRVVLAASSEYFCAMFTDGMWESHETEIELRDSSITPAAFQIILDFVYKSTLQIAEDNVFEVLGAADHLQIRSAVERCSEFISKAVVNKQLNKMDIQSLQKVLDIADRHSLLDLRDEVFHKIALVFKEATESEEFLERIQVKNLLSLLQRNDLTAPSETFVFEAVIKWIYYDKEERLGEAANLIRALRLGLVDITVLITELRRPELWGIKKCRSILLEVSLYNNMPSLLPELRMVKSEPRTTSSVLTAIKQNVPLNFYDTTKQQWKEFGEKIPVNEPCQAVVCSGSYIYVGGMQTVYRYNIDSNTWDQLPSMVNNKKGKYQLLVLGDYLYAIGPRPERYSFREKSWQPIADIMSTWSVLGNEESVAVMTDTIYAVGSGRYNRYALVHCFNPSKNQWEQKATSLSCRINGCAFVCNDKLIVAGGQTSSIQGRYIVWSPLEAVESYCRETDSWSQIEQKRIAPQDSSFACEADNKIFFKLNNFVFDSGIRVSPDQVYPVKLDEWRNIAAFELGAVITYAPMNMNKLLNR